MDVAAEMEGEVVECRTRLTSFAASADQRSTVRTKYEVSISLSEMQVSLVLHVLSSITKTKSRLRYERRLTLCPFLCEYLHP